MRCGRANPSSDGFESLLDIYNKTPLNGRHVNPFSLLIEYLQSSCVVLGQEGKETRRVLVRADTLGVLRCGWVFHKLQPAHITLEAIKRLPWEGQAFCDEAYECLRQAISLRDIFFNQVLNPWAIWILLRVSGWAACLRERLT